MKLYIATGPRFRAANPPHVNLQILYTPPRFAIVFRRFAVSSPRPDIDPMLAVLYVDDAVVRFYIYTHILYILLYLSYKASNILLLLTRLIIQCVVEIFLF